MNYNSISSKFALMAIGVVVCTAATIGLFQYWQYTTDQLEREAERLDFAVQGAAGYLKDVIADARRKALFLAKVPPVQGIIRAKGNGGLDPSDNSSERIWKDRLAQIIAPMAESAPDLLQIRFIGASSNGREIVRVDRQRGRIFRASEADLQEKGRRDYVKETLKLFPGSVSISDIDLNRERGKVEQPPKPVLRITTPVYAQKSGEAFGLIAINVRMKPVLERFTKSLSSGRKLYLTNENGDYLVHPDISKTFGFDLGPMYRMQAEFVELTPFINNTAQQKFSTTIKTAEGEQIAHIAKFPFDPGKPRRYFIAAALSPMSHLLAKSRSTRNNIFIVVGVLALIGAVVAIVSSLYIIKPLNELKIAAQQLAAGAEVETIAVPRERQDEVGGLARSFYAMATTLEERQDKLEEKEASITAILETAASPIITIDDKGIVQGFNPATICLFGYSKEELIGSNVSKLMTGRDRDSHDQYLKNYIEGKGARMIGIGREVEALRNDGTTVPVHLAVSEVRLKDKRMFTGIITDLTKQKKIDKLKSEFVSTVSHELRTPLTSIKGSLGLLKAAVVGDLPEQVNSMINIAYSNSDRLVRLINDILDIEKIEAGKLTFAFQRTNLGLFLLRTIEANKAYAEELGVTLELSAVPEDLQVETDPDRLTQVLTNLMSNAAKFSPKGEVVSVKAEKLGGMVRVSVTDRGPGVAKDFHEKMFGKFAQADSSDTRAQGGTGLGLAITKAIVEAHGGSINFETIQYEGTTFYFDLPIVQKIATLAPALDHGGKPKVLICEDDADTATLLRLIIENVGYEATICSNAAEAKTYLSANRFSAMTLDLGLPGQGGASLIRELRQSPATQDLPILVVSARADEGHEDLNGSAFSVVDWLDKPIDPERLCSGIRRAVAAINADIVRILYIEDNDDHKAIVSSLIRRSDVIDFAKTCAEAQPLLQKNDYDLVILDLLLPDGQGEDLLPLIHGNGSRPPQVLVFSIKELPESLSDKVNSALVKSQTSNEVLRRQIQGLLGADFTDYEIDLSKQEVKSVA